MYPKKLIRDGIVKHLKDNEWEFCNNPEELNRLYALKVQEELKEVQASDHEDVTEFADLLEAVTAFASTNGFSAQDLSVAMTAKNMDKGYLDNTVLTNLNPNNPSNQIYFNKVEKPQVKAAAKIDEAKKSEDRFDTGLVVGLLTGFILTLGYAWLAEYLS